MTDTIVKMHYICPHCGKTTVFDGLAEADLTDNPDLYVRIMRGETFRDTCAFCGTENKIIYDMRAFSTRKHYSVQLSAPKRRDLYARKFTMMINGGDRTVFRITSSLNAFKEKISIFEAGRDDRVIEAAKRIVMEEALKLEKDLRQDFIRWFHDARNDREYWLLLGNDGKLRRIPFDPAVYAETKEILMWSEEESFFIDAEWSERVTALASGRRRA